MNGSSAGVLIRLRNAGFKKVKTVAVSAVEQVTDAQTGETTGHLTHPSYRAGLSEAPTFANHLWAST